jgi:hypothetical protein
MSPSRLTTDAARFCQRPLVRRAYSGLVVALAVFLLTLVVLREPFHGYLAEVRIAGPAASRLDLDAARTWLKAADPHVVVVAVPAAGSRTHSEVRMTWLGPVAAEATNRLDELAGRLLYQYLPDQLQAHRRSVLRQARQAVAAAREREDTARLKVERLRQEQLADLLERRPSHPGATGPSRSLASSADQIEDANSPLRKQLDALRADLARLLASFTEAHPEVIRLRSQINGLEEQLFRARSQQEADAAAERRASPVRTQYVAAVATSAGEAQPVDQRDYLVEIEAALRALAVASRERQAAEHQSSDMLQELSARPTAADWSAQPAYVVTRIGGTPRRATLALAWLLATIAGAVIFRTAAAIASPKMETTRDLAAALEIPVIGNAASPPGTVQSLFRLWTPSRVTAVVRTAEAVLVVAALSCLAAIAVEPALTSQVFADPFGALSEVVGRFG